MLHHGHIAIGRLLLNVNFAFLDVLELDLLVFFGLCINRGAGKGRIKRRLSDRGIAVPHQLHVQLRRHRRGAGVDDFMPHRDVVCPPFEGVGFDQLDAAKI